MDDTGFLLDLPDPLASGIFSSSGGILAPANGSNGLFVLAAPHAASAAMLALAARLAHRYPFLRVIDGGNRFNAYLVAQELRRLGESQIYTSLKRIRVQRAFTCYQVTTLLDDIALQGPPHPPTLVFDLLDTFFDESVPLDERRQLAGHCVQRLRQLAEHAPVLASLRPLPPEKPDPTGLFEIVQKAADTLWLYQPPAPPLQHRLFPQE